MAEHERKTRDHVGTSDKQTNDESVRNMAPFEQPPVDDTEELIDEAQDAIEAMEAREHRRDSTYRTGGDHESPGIDTDMDSNAPKDQERPRKKAGGSQGKSDWR